VLNGGPDASKNNDASSQLLSYFPHDCRLWRLVREASTAGQEMPTLMFHRGDAALSIANDRVRSPTWTRKDTRGNGAEDRRDATHARRSPHPLIPSAQQ
jgi:hypothetical protein